MTVDKMSNFRKYLIIFVLTFFGAAIYKVTYLKEVFELEILETLQITNTQLGALGSAVGITAMIGYFFGGFLADRFSSKLLITIGCFGGGVLTLIYAMFPPYQILLLVHIGIAFCGTLIFWAAYIRIVRILGGKDGQGRYFGAAEGSRSLIGICIPFGALAIMQALPTQQEGLRMVLIYYAICYFIAGILTLFFVSDLKDNSIKKTVFNKSEYIKLLKTPGLWLVTMLVFGTYGVFALQSYTTRYMIEVAGISNGTAQSLAILRQYGLGLIAMPICGFFADKIIKSATKTAMVGLVLLFASAAGILLVPASSHIMVMIFVLAIGTFVSGVRGIYYATMDEASITKALSGAAIGIVSTIGFSSDAFVFTQVGGWLDKYPVEKAFEMIFMYMLIFITIAIVAGIGILILARKARNKSIEE